MALVNFQFSFILYTCAVLLVIVTEINCQAMYKPNSEHPDHPGMCYYDDSYSPEENRKPMLLKPGQKRKHPTACLRIDCSETLGLSVIGCGVQGSHNHCQVVKGDKSRPYPYCCAELIC